MTFASMSKIFCVQLFLDASSNIFESLLVFRCARGIGFLIALFDYLELRTSIEIICIDAALPVHLTQFS